MEAQNELELISKDVTSLKKRVVASEIKTQEDLTDATDLLKVIKNKMKFAEAKRVDFKQPFLDGGKKIDAEFKPYINDLEDIRRILEKDKIIPYQLEQEKIEQEKERVRREEERKALEAKQKIIDELAEKTNSEFAKNESLKIEEEKQELATAPIEVDTAIRSNYTTSSIRKAWKYEVVDYSKVPKLFLMVDDKHIKNAISQGMREIAGLRIYEEATGVNSR